MQELRYKIFIWFLRTFFPDVLEDVLMDIERAEQRVFMLHDFYGEEHSIEEFLD